MIRFFKKIFWVRGAISFNEDKKEDIEKTVLKFINAFQTKYKIKSNDILVIFIIAPKNLTSSYPCTFLRKNGFTFPCITSSDILIKDTPQNILRFLIQCKSYKKPEDLYLDDAVSLRDKIDKLIDS